MLMLTTFFRPAALSRSRMPSWPQHVTVPLRRTAHVRPREAAMRLSPLRASPRTNSGPRTTATRSGAGVGILGAPGPGHKSRTDPWPRPEPGVVASVAPDPRPDSGLLPHPGASPPAATSSARTAGVGRPAQRRHATDATITRGPEPSRALPLPGSNCSPPSVVLLRDHQGERTTASDSTPPTAGGVATTAAHRSARVTPRRAAPRGFRSAVVPGQRLQWFQLQILSMPPRVAGLKSVPRV